MMESSVDETGSRSANRRAVIVVGPGRSGTSAITRALQALGIDLGDNLKPGMRKNAKGFFEDLDLLEINYRLHALFGLRRNGSSVRDVRNDPAWSDASLAAIQSDARAILRDRFAGSRLWGFKVGGVMRLLPAWEPMLKAEGNDIAYVLAIRNPISVAKSRAKLDQFRGVQEKSDLEWLVQVIPYFDRMRRHPFVVVDYDDLLADPAGTLARMAATLGLDPRPADHPAVRTYCDEFLSDNLRHNAVDPGALAKNERLNPLTRDLYVALLRLSRGEMRPDDDAFLAEIGRIEAAWTAMEPVLRHVDELEGRLRRRGIPIRNIWSAILQHLPSSGSLGRLINHGLGAFRRTARPSTLPTD